TTSALVWQHCDGQTTPEQLMELLRQNLNVSRAQAEQLTWLALDELGKANLLEAEVARPRPLSSKLTRRQMLTTFATAGAGPAARPTGRGCCARRRANGRAGYDAGEGPGSSCNPQWGANDLFLKRNGLYQ